jgi:glycosyltransferase involved in cell wall biosynthesis
MDMALAESSGIGQAMAFADLAVYDDVLPSPASPFRTLEYGHYLNFFPSSVLVSTEAWHFGFAHAGLGDLRASLPVAEHLKRRIFGFEAARDLVPKLAYVTFLGNAERLLPYFEARQLPFILQLYPGGSFEPNVKTSDDRLRAVVHSPLCRKVIATQKLTVEHLLNRIGCSPDKVELIYGGVFDSRVDFDFSRDKRRYGVHKESIDLCFVAHRYSDDMAQKGYDQFVEVARLLASDERLRFHVVGDYTPDDLPLGEAAQSFVFHGTQPSTFFVDFYPRMDVILSANRPYRGREGAFDGFPTGACMEAGFRGVLNCVADPLDLNVVFEDGRDILLVDRNAELTARRLAELFATPDRLYALAHANWKRFHEVFDVDRQLWARTRLIVTELLRGETLVTRPAAPIGWTAVNSRHDPLMAEYQKLAEAYENLRAYTVQREEVLSSELQQLAEAHQDLRTYATQREEVLSLELQNLAEAHESSRTYAARREEVLSAENQRRRVLSGSLRAMRRSLLNTVLGRRTLR